MHTHDHTESRETIAAIATPAGAGGIGVIRVSGADALAIAKKLTRRNLQDRLATYVKVRDAHGDLLDTALATLFKAPRSFTGEDVLEIATHGAPVVLARVLARVCALGARPARAGEFSERAFLNGKIDLVQAEAVADLIASQSEAQARAALRSLQGEFSKRIEDLLTPLIELRVYVEAAIDFPEEEIDFLADGEVQKRLSAVIKHCDLVLQEARQGQRLRDGLHVVIIGAPNAGKSSLLNALARHDRAIVTPIAGTTRDVLREDIQLDGVALTLADTAGLRDTPDVIEAEGIRRAHAELERADLILLIHDASSGEQPVQSIAQYAHRGVPLIVVHNKLDLQGSETVVFKPYRILQDDLPHIGLSAKQGDGLDLLREEIRRHAGHTHAHAAAGSHPRSSMSLGAGEVSTGVCSARARHVHALEAVANHLQIAEQRLQKDRAGELVAEELRQAQQQLATITGDYTSDDLLGAIFSSFCIGK